jgi:hypothetical protein
MEWTSLVDYGIAAIIAFQMNRKLDAFIQETKKMHGGMLRAFNKIAGAVDSHGTRLDRIEGYLTAEDEPEPETQITGFTA